MEGVSSLAGGVGGGRQSRYDNDALKDLVRAALAQRDNARADAAAAQAEQSDIAAYIAHLKLQIEKLKRTIYGPRAERTVRLLAQMEFELEELEASATEDELRAEQEAVKAVEPLLEFKPPCS